MVFTLDVCPKLAWDGKVISTNVNCTVPCLAMLAQLNFTNHAGTAQHDPAQFVL